METLLGCTFKRGGGKVKVQQIPMSRDTRISQGFIDFVANRIRSTERLWTCTAVKVFDETLLSPEVSKMEIIDIPITPAPTSNEEKMTEEPVKRNYSQRRMQATSIMHMSDTTKRRLTEKGFEVIQKGFNCNKSQASEIAQLVCKKQLGTLKATEDTPHTNVTNNNTQNFQESQLRPECLEKVMKKITTFTEVEKIAVVESLADCKTQKEIQDGLKHLQSIMAPKDSRYTSIDLQKLGRWTDRHERIKNGKVGVHQNQLYRSAS